MGPEARATSRIRRENLLYEYNKKDFPSFFKKLNVMNIPFLHRKIDHDEIMENHETCFNAVAVCSYTIIVHVGCQYCIFDPPAEASLDIKYGRHA